MSLSRRRFLTTAAVATLGFPALLRARRPDLRIGFFLHIPFPPIEIFRNVAGKPIQAPFVPK